MNHRYALIAPVVLIASACYAAETTGTFQLAGQPQEDESGYHFQASDGSTTFDFTIPASDPDYEDKKQIVITSWMVLLEITYCIEHSGPYGWTVFAISHA